MRGLRRGLAVLVLAAAAVAAGTTVYVRHWLDAPLAISKKPLTVEIMPGQPLAAVAHALADRGVLDHPRLLSMYASATKTDQRVRAGEYAVPPGTTPRSLLRSVRERRRGAALGHGGRRLVVPRAAPRIGARATARAHDRRSQRCRRHDHAGRCRATSGRAFLSGHVSLWQGYGRHRHPATGARTHAQGTRRSVGRAAGRPAVQHPLRSIDPGLDR